MLPSARATASSRNSSAMLLCNAKKPSRQALMGQRAGQPCFADSSWTDQQNVMMQANPLAGRPVCA